MYLSDELAERLAALPLSDRYDICAEAAAGTKDQDERSRLFSLALNPRLGEEMDYEHLMSCRDPHCLRCSPVAA